MKKFKRIASVILAVAIIGAMFSGCSAINAIIKKKALVGSWKATYDMSDYINEGFNSENALGMDMDFGGKLVADITFTYDNNYCSVSVDEDKLNESMTAYADEAAKYLSDKLYKQFEEENGLSKEEIDKNSKDTYGMTFDKYIKSTISDSLSDSTVSDLVSSIEQKYSYFIEGDKIMYQNQDSKKIYQEYTIDGDKMTITKETYEDGKAVSDDDAMYISYPTTLTRVAAAK